MKVDESESAGALHAGSRDGLAGELFDALEERRAAGERVDDGARVVVLAFQVRQPVRILAVLHPAIGIADGFAEVGVLDHFDARDRRGRDRVFGGGRRPELQWQERQR
jgi:hypothetical protein